MPVVKVLDPRFADPLALDYRLSPEMMNRLAVDYPEGSVPIALLGIQR